MHIWLIIEDLEAVKQHLPLKKLIKPKRVTWLVEKWSSMI